MEADEGDNSEQDDCAEEEAYRNKKVKIYFGSDSEGEEVKENKNKGEEEANRKESMEEPGVNVGSMRRVYQIIKESNRKDNKIGKKNKGITMMIIGTLFNSYLSIRWCSEKQFNSLL